MTQQSIISVLGLLSFALVGCSGNRSKQESSEEKSAASKPKNAPEKFYVEFDTTKGDVILEVVRAWAPIGVDRFYELVQAKFFDGARFFRVRPNFVVQFGISKDPKVTELWRQLKLADDPVKQKNLRGFVSYATSGPDTRTTQVFINLADNTRLDARGFSPFARVVEGMDVVDKFHTYGEVQSLGGGGPDPQKIEAMGDEYLERSFPRLDRINRAAVIDYAPKE